MFSPQNRMSLLPLSIQQNTKRVGYYAIEGMDLLGEQTGKERGFLLPCPLHRLPTEAKVHLKVDLLIPKIRIARGSFYFK